MKNYYEAVGEDMSNCLPLTYHIKNRNDSEFQKFIENFQKSKAQSKINENIWIIKPGENTNRGNGIEVKRTLKDIIVTVEDFFSQGRTVIL